MNGAGGDHQTDDHLTIEERVAKLRAESAAARERLRHWPLAKDVAPRPGPPAAAAAPNPGESLRSDLVVEIREVLAAASDFTTHEDHCRADAGYECTCGFSTWNDRRHAVMTKLEALA